MSAFVAPPINVLMIGTGEYTTGYVGGDASKSDKGAGVVALSMFDFRSRGKVDRVGMVGVNGKKMPEAAAAAGQVAHVVGIIIGSPEFQRK